MRCLKKSAEKLQTAHPPRWSKATSPWPSSVFKQLWSMVNTVSVCLLALWNTTSSKINLPAKQVDAMEPPWRGGGATDRVGALWESSEMQQNGAKVQTHWRPTCGFTTSSAYVWMCVCVSVCVWVYPSVHTRTHTHDCMILLIPFNNKKSGFSF